MSDLTSLSNFIIHLLHLIILILLPIFLISIEIYQAIKTRRKTEKIRRFQDIFAVTFAIVRLELYVSESLILNKNLSEILIESLGMFVLFLLLFSISEAYVHHGLPIGFLKKMMSRNK